MKEMFLDERIEVNPMPYLTLNEKQVQHFLNNGFVIIKNCFSRDFAKIWVDLAYERLGFNPADSMTWAKGIIHTPAYNYFRIKELSPLGWGAACDLLGDECRVKTPHLQFWGDSFIVNFHDGADCAWQPPSLHDANWHVGGDDFVHFLDSNEQGLVQVVIWQDIPHQGGGTFLALDSIQSIVQMLLEHPEGILPDSPLWGAIAAQCSNLVELSGEAGDVIMVHPLMLHTFSRNCTPIPSFITHASIPLQQPMNFNRENPDEFSLVEQVILNALNVDRLAFKMTATRKKVVPARVHLEHKMLEEQKARLARPHN